MHTYTTVSYPEDASVLMLSMLFVDITDICEVNRLGDRLILRLDLPPGELDDDVVLLLVSMASVICLHHL